MSNAALKHNEIDAATIKCWLIEKFAYKLECDEGEIDEFVLFTDFGLDSTEVLLLAGELEDWLGMELSPTAMWYHPTIDALSNYIAEEYKENN